MRENLIRALTENYHEYLCDESHTYGHATLISFPRSEAEVCEVLRTARSEGWPVTVSGARTGISAGCVPDGGLVLSLSRMTGILGMRRDTDGGFLVRAEPGVVLSEFDKCVESKKFPVRNWDAPSQAAFADFCAAGEFFFAPDPTERSASLGGMAACNASGARTYKYGPMRRHVTGIRLALADGRICALRRGACTAEGHTLTLPLEDGSALTIPVPTYRMPDTKNTSGYYAAAGMDAMDLLIGSDGTLGVITELEVRLTPAPAFVWGVTSFFPDEAASLRYVRALRRDLEDTAAIEYFDGDALEILRRQKAESPAFARLPAVPDGAGAAVYAEFHCPDEESAMNRLFAAGEATTAAGGRETDTLVARTADDRAALSFFRHAIPESVNMLISRRKRDDPVITKLGTDMAVGDGDLEAVLAVYRNGLKEAGLESAVWGHIGNNHLHVNILPRNAEDYRAGRALYLRWAETVSRMGGAVSSEHAAGKSKASMLRIMYAPEHMAEMLAVKTAFDPARQLGQGTIFGKEEEETRP